MLFNLILKKNNDLNSDSEVNIKDSMTISFLKIH